MSGLDHLSITFHELPPVDFFAQVEVAAIYLEYQKKFLLLESAEHKWQPRRWGVPAGKLEAGEEALQGAQRELQEETGLLLDLCLFHPLGPLYAVRSDLKFIYHMFAVRLQELPPIQLSLEHLTSRWETAEGAKKLPLITGAEQALDIYYARKSCLPSGETRGMR